MIARAHEIVEAGQEAARSLPRGTRICIVADGRSPITRNWVSYFVARGDEVHLISTYPFDPEGLDLASAHVLPVAFARFAGGRWKGSAAKPSSGRSGLAQRIRSAVGSALPAVRAWLGPMDVRRYVPRARTLIRDIDPVLVHAMRIPYEGILASAAVDDLPHPLIVSVWGNDLELWAAHYRGIGSQTRRTLGRATGLHPDCARDLNLAERWGWNRSKPSAVLPSNGGIRTEIFHPGAADAAVLERYGLTDGRPMVLNARGFRQYVRNDTFFRSIPLVLERRPDVRFAATGMHDDPRALRWLRDLRIDHAVRLLPLVSPGEMASLFRLAVISVSPSNFDGTPNTLLESMACGAFPLAGDIASVREWIDDGVNGMLFDQSNPLSLADAVLRALSDDSLRARAAAHNCRLVAERAEFTRSMARAESLYAEAIRSARAASVT